MAYQIEINRFHYDLQVAAADLFVPYICQAMNQLYYWKAHGKPGPQGPQVGKDEYASRINPFLEALDAGVYAMQVGQLSETTDVYIGDEAFRKLADALGIPDQVVFQALSADVQHVKAGGSPKGWKSIWDYFGKIPHPFLPEQWQANQDANDWAAAHGHASGAAGGGSGGGAGAGSAAGPGIGTLVILLGGGYLLSKVMA